MNEYLLKLRNEIEKMGLKLADGEIHKLNQFIELLLEVNQHTNLTAITDFEEITFKHLYDSLLIYNINEFRNATQIIDIGTGAGFPCIPLAICFPEKQFISLEATKKKINFQQEVVNLLNLKNIKCIWNRAEVLARDVSYRGQFDLVIARAVAASNVLAELTIPFIKVNSHAVFYKGKEVEKEIELSKNAIRTLGAKIKAITTYCLPDNHGERSLIVIEKVSNTSDLYPRNPGIPLKKPL
jgi:16S rRNA (guanine527-N7)-methyltransferase